MKRISCKEDLNDWLEYEKNIYKQSGKLKILMKKLAGSETTIIYFFQRRLRITEYYHNCNFKIRKQISLVLLNRYRNKYCLHIGLNVFGKGLKIMHLGPILTNGNVRTGENIAVHINTHFVAQGVNNGVPQLGSNIVVGVGAVILGNVIIADGIAIGANSVVTKSFEEENIAIAGVPAKKISNNGRGMWNNKQLTYKVN